MPVSLPAFYLMAVALDRLVPGWMPAGPEALEPGRRGA
jgi:hypothetical protein